MFTTGRGMLKFTPPLSIDPEAMIEAAEQLNSDPRSRMLRAPDLAPVN